MHPERYRRGVPSVADTETERVLGVTPRSSVDELVAYVARHGLEGAFACDDAAREAPRSRRWSRHRAAVGEAAAIEAVNLTTGQPPLGRQASPSLRQLRRLYRWAARVRPTPHDP